MKLIWIFYLIQQQIIIVAVSAMKRASQKLKVRESTFIDAIHVLVRNDPSTRLGTIFSYFLKRIFAFLSSIYMFLKC